MPTLDSPFKILELIGPNAYKVDLPGQCGVFATINVANLNPQFAKSEELPNLRAESLQEGGLMVTK